MDYTKWADKQKEEDEEWEAIENGAFCSDWEMNQD